MNRSEILVRAEIQMRVFKDLDVTRVATFHSGKYDDVKYVFPARDWPQVCLHKFRQMCGDHKWYVLECPLVPPSGPEKPTVDHPLVQEDYERKMKKYRGYQAQYERELEDWELYKLASGDSDLAPLAAMLFIDSRRDYEGFTIELPQDYSMPSSMLEDWELI